MKFVVQMLDAVWNLHFIKGHRTTVAQVCLMLTAGLTAYQGMALSPELIAAGVDLPDLSTEVLSTVALLTAYFAKKVRTFAQENVRP